MIVSQTNNRRKQKRPANIKLDADTVRRIREMVDERENIRCRLRDEYSDAALAKRLHCGAATIWRARVGQYKLAMRHAHIAEQLRTLDDEKCALLLQYRELTQTGIARRLGVHWNTVFLAQNYATHKSVR
jgi:predicted DNA-binding protein (UPF0251 family)